MNGYDHLQQFAGAYFHQDWPLEADTADEVLQGYADETSADVRRLVAEEIKHLLSQSDEAIETSFKRFGLYYDPASEGLSIRQWLTKVEGLLRAK